MATPAGGCSWLVTARSRHRALAGTSALESGGPRGWSCAGSATIIHHRLHLDMRRGMLAREMACWSAAPAAGQPLDVPSVASVFASRRDKAADPLLSASLHGRLGLAVTQQVHASYRSLLSGHRRQVLALARAGARPLRVL